MQQQEQELLGELRDKRDTKLKRLMKELDGVNFHVAKACSLQVHNYIHVLVLLYRLDWIGLGFG